MSESSPLEPQANPFNRDKTPSNLFVVGIGASAGGLSALEEFFTYLAPNTGAAFVVIQHLSPDFKSLMKELLERHTSMPVNRIVEGMKLQPNSIYLIPPGQNLSVDNHVLQLKERLKDKNNKLELNFPIDLFFTSLAKNFGEQAIGVVLSGSGSDGTRGLKAINEAGGFTLVQDPKTAEFAGMPQSAIATGVVNQILPPEELAQLIYQCIVSPDNSDVIEANQISSSDLSRVAKLLIEEEGLDFSEYKPSTISRRIHRRYLIHNSHNIDEYIRFLCSSPNERKILCSDLLINVTHFFRNYPAWQDLEDNVLPQLIAQKEPGAELRFWITACSTGEEAYSLAILVYEAIERADKNLRVKIFATDIDRVALSKASHGIYATSIARDIGSERLHTYFIARDNCYQIMRKIREMLIFSPHDLTKDAGFTKIDLATCRNVLIYMKPKLQDWVLRSLHFALVPQGVLFLGEAETLSSFKSEFKPLNKKWKLFQKLRNISLPLGLRSTPKISKRLDLPYVQPQTKSQFEPILEQCLHRLADTANSIILLIDQNNCLLHVSGNSSKIFKAPDGKVTTEVVKMVVPALELPLKTALHRAKLEKKPISYQNIKLEYQGENFSLNLEVIPPQGDRRRGDFSIVKLESELSIAPSEIQGAETFELTESASKRICALENELEQTRENLQTLVEELETTSEEQQASNEELTASNEELQSTNEELHSVNEELHTVNIEYQSKIQELTELNNDVDNLLKSTEIGVIFLDAEQRIRKFTPAAKIAVALREADLNRPLAELHWKFECPHLFALLAQVFKTQQSYELEVKLKEGDGYLLMQIHLYYTENGDSEGLVISFIGIDEIKQVQAELQAEIVARQNSEAKLLITKQRVENIFGSLEDAVWSYDLAEQKLGYVNSSFRKIYGRTTTELVNNQDLWLYVVHPEDRKRVEFAHRSTKLKKTLDLEYRIVHEDSLLRWVRDRSKTIYDDRGTAIRHDFIISNITAQKEIQQALKTKEQSFQAIFNSMFQFIGVLNPEGILLEANQTALASGGLILEEAINRPFWETKWWTISTATQEQLKEAIARAASGEFVRYEVDVLGAQNLVTTIDFSLKPVTDEAGKVVQLISEGRDISELKQTREQLKQTNQALEQRVAKRTQSLAQFSDRLQKLHRLATSNYQQPEDLFADYLEAGCQMLNLSTGIISNISDGVYTILAVKSPLKIDKGYRLPCTDTYSAEVIKIIDTETVAEIGNIESMRDHPVYRHLNIKSFITAPIIVNGNLGGTLDFADPKIRASNFTLEDIKIVELMAKDLGNFIASIQSQAALKKSELFRNTFEQAAVGVAHISIEGKFVKVNQSLRNILGYDEALPPGLTFQEITHPDDMAQDEQFVRQLLANEVQSCLFEKRYIKKDKSIVWVNVTASLAKDNWGQPDYFIAVIEDISDRKATEIALEQSRTRLKEANRAKDNFIANMSHELRTPLNSVIGFSHILQQDPNLNSEQLKSIDVINQSGQHLLSLINDVLDLSKLSVEKLELKYQDLNLTDFLAKISAVFQTRAQSKGLNFRTNLAPDLPKVIKADETRLKQVLFNLLTNAIKFTSEGSVTLSVSIATLPSDNINRLRFQIEDTGQGIPQEKYHTVFATFGQVDATNGDVEGTGLGIPISQNILQLMNSELHFGSKLGQGSCFWFDLDVEVGSSSLPSTPELDLQVNRVLGSPCKVLVVDDNGNNRLLLVEYLQPLGFVLQEADNGLKGIELAHEFKPDVILIDLLMPIMNGKETIECIRQHPQLKDTVVLMISANIQSIIDSSDIKCDGFLAKPVNLAQLLELLERHLSLKWQAWQPPQQANLVTETTAFPIPQATQLTELLKLANFGEMQAVLEQVELLLAKDSQYISFVERVRRLAEGCQQNKLEDLLQELIESDS